MPPRDVQNMDVVAQASAVRGVVVISINTEEFPLACGRLEQQRDNVSLRTVSLAPFRGAPRSIKIAQRSHAPTIGARVPIERPFEHQLSFAIAVNWIFGLIFRYGGLVRDSIH